MDQNNLVKLSSISKKICVALLGAFLLIFLLVHASANLCILRADEGTWYTDFCHFFGTNYVVKVFEVILMAALLFHIILTVALQCQNWKARGTVRYHHASKTKTHTGSKLMIWTGILIFAFLVMHLMQFWCVKMNITEGKYMVQTEKMMKEAQSFGQSEKAMRAQSIFMTQNIQSQEEYEAFINELKSKQNPTAEEQDALDIINLNEIMMGMDQDMEGKYIHGLTKAQRDAIDACLPEAEVEPDFYVMARDKFSIWWMDLIYLLTFVVLWFHMRHAFQSAFQTLGLNNLKYGKAIDFVAVAYATLICLMFAAVPVLVFLGL